MPGGEGADGAENSFLGDQRRQFEVRVGYQAFWVDEADQILGYVLCPLDVSVVVIAVFVWFYPDPAGTQAQSFGAAEVRSGTMDQLRKVGEAVYHIGA